MRVEVGKWNAKVWLVRNWRKWDHVFTPQPSMLMSHAQFCVNDVDMLELWITICI